METEYQIVIMTVSKSVERAHSFLRRTMGRAVAVRETKDCLQVARMLRADQRPALEAQIAVEQSYGGWGHLRFVGTREEVGF